MLKLSLAQLLVTAVALGGVMSSGEATGGKGMYRNEDIEALNLAITMENLKGTFYQESMSAGISITKGLGRNRRVELRDVMRRLVSSSSDYVVVLTRAVRMMGGTPLQRCSYQFQPYGSSLSAGDYILMMSRSFETVSMQVYNGLQSAMINPRLREMVSEMATAQSSHRAYLNSLARQDPFSESFESAMSARQGLSFFKRYINSCPFSILGGTFRSMTVKPEMGYTGSRILIGIVGSRSATNDTKSDTAPADASTVLPTAPLNTTDTKNPTLPLEPEIINESNTTMPNDLSGNKLRRRSDRLPGYSEYCLFISGNRQVFSEYDRGCTVPQGLPTGLTFVHLVRERARITFGKIDHILAGPASFDIVGYGSIVTGSSVGVGVGPSVVGAIPAYPNIPPTIITTTPLQQGYPTMSVDDAMTSVISTSGNVGNIGAPDSLYPILDGIGLMDTSSQMSQVNSIEGLFQPQSQQPL